MIALGVLLLIAAGLSLISALTTWAFVDEPRKPITPGDGALTTIIQAAYVALFILSALALFAHS